MNKDIIKKYKKEFDAWVNGEEVEFADDDRADEWYGVGDSHTWHNSFFIYRIKPKPLECWVNEYGSGNVIHWTKEDAKEAAKGICLRIAVHMREVEES